MKKIAKISAVVTAAVVLSGCSGGSGGSGTSSDNYYEEPTNPVNPDIDPTDPTIPTEPTNPDQYPAYYINEEFGGQKFVDADTNWYNENQATKDQEFTASYQSAQKFMNEKVAELNQMIEGQTSNALYKEIKTALKNINRNPNIGDNVTNNYKALAPVFASLENPFVKDNDELQYNRFKASYHKLAANAYNNSLGSHKGSNTFQTNKEIRDDLQNYEPSAAYIKEIELAGLQKGELTNDRAKTIMKETLTLIGDRAGVGFAVLEKVVELALYNESLYGLNDIARAYNVNTVSRGTDRTYDTFDTYIYDARHNISTQSIDDRTM